ncbi:MAG: AAA family ATPase, partial [Candidatus Pacebacteria bacterium]|nr:AAA family ATPase [Candidatus Paceibacterota bacterium]
MNLNSFHIDGFGIFHDLEAQDFPDGLMLVRGDNEAGKSTCLAFIRAVLFGFPDKRMARKQYPPLRGGTHGGRLTFTSKEFGTVIVQRHPGTHGGAVTLTFDDGSTGGKRELNDLLAGMTADLFRNIYAFSLNELQTLDSLQDDSVGTALYAASSGAGLAALANAQNTVSNRLDELFKPGGRKPAINHLLGQLDQVRQKLRESTGTLSLYADTKLELKTLEHQLDETRKTLDQVSLHLRKVDSCLAAWEDWTTLQTAENDLKTLPLVVTSFPPDGLERFERLNDAHRRCMEERDNLRR